MAAIRNPSQLDAKVMEVWTYSSVGSRIVVTGTEAKSLEELANHPSTPYGTLLAIETVIKARNHLFCSQSLIAGKGNRKFPKDHVVEVVCMETINEFIVELAHTKPLAWIHLGHGDYENNPNDEECETGQAMLSDGESEDNWIPTDRISNTISESQGKESIMFCILPVCCSSQSGDVLQENRNILAIHATASDKVSDGSPQLLEMSRWGDPVLSSLQDFWLTIQDPS